MACNLTLFMRPLSATLMSQVETCQWILDSFRNVAIALLVSGPRMKEVLVFSRKESCIVSSCNKLAAADGSRGESSHLYDSHLAVTALESRAPSCRSKAIYMQLAVVVTDYCSGVVAWTGLAILLLCSKR